MFSFIIIISLFIVYEACSELNLSTSFKNCISRKLLHLSKHWRIPAINWSLQCLLDAVVHRPYAWAGHEFCMLLWWEPWPTMTPLIEKIASGMGIQSKNVLTHFVEIWAVWFHLHNSIDTHSNLLASPTIKPIPHSPWTRTFVAAIWGTGPQVT